MPTTTPKKVTGQIRDLCKMIVADGVPVFVDVEPDPFAELQDCFMNVKKAVEREGGRIAYGWSLWIWPQVFAEAEHHAVWERPDGSLVDVTPKLDEENRILFLRDDSKPYDFEHNRRRDNVRMALNSDPRLKEMIDSAAAVQAYLETKEVINGEFHLDRAELEPLALRSAMAMEAVFRRYLKSSDPCTCGSKRQVRRCCGLEQACLPQPPRPGVRL